MIQYRLDRFTKQLFRRAGDGPQEYIAKEKQWQTTPDAVDAFYDSSDSKPISEKEAIEVMERQGRAVGGN
ncbi:MAG TPA: hypothetical protein PK824_01105 [Bacilli bacterium]|nr:hypothetical protein [Bacilli bacterium]